ncbi:MAG: hypothetical protein FWD69_14645 [Polyangiaceae bacterium]|nr:hypothetical protein [Polyangiaceae bacterium]
MKRNGLFAVAFLALPLSLALACSKEDKGDLQIFVVPEDTITQGLQPGTDMENVQDGWTITYDRFLVAIGNFRATRTDTGASIGDSTVHILDLRNAPTSGYVTNTFSNIDAVRWDKFGFDMPNAKPGDTGLSPTRQEDVDFMVQNGFSVYFEGAGQKDGKTIRFKWGFSAGTSFSDCASPDGLAGFAVPASGTIQIKPTIHGDHWFFDNVTQGVEITTRLAQWLEICDADQNGDLTIAELKACDVTDALPQPPYDLTSVRDQDGDGFISVFDYVDSQVRTIGEFQGDGECPTRSPVP